MKIEKGLELPKNKCGNPAALSAMISGYSTDGPQPSFAVENPAFTLKRSTAIVLCPGSRRQYALVPKRCGLSTAPAPIGSPHPHGMVEGANGNTLFSVLKTIGNMESEIGPNCAYAPAC